MEENLTPTFVKKKEAGPSRSERRAIRRARWALAMLPVAFLAGLLAGHLLWGGSPSAATQGQVTRYDVPVDGDPAIGPSKAPVTIIEFSDYQCPYCRKFHVEVLPQILSAYKDKVRFVYRDFPLSSHPEAAPAAEASGCAYEQGKFWEFHDKLFTGGQTLGKDTYLQYASDLGLDMQQFQSCLSSRKYQSEVQSDFDFAANLGVRSTPTFFINGIPLVGAQPFEAFQQVIDKELAGN